MKTRLFNEILFGMEFQNWREAVHFVAEDFVKNGYASAHYFDEICKEMVATQAYMVITPGFALLHSAPEKGALKKAFHLMTLKTPIEFGHPSNDPVDLILTFTSTDTKEHLQSIRQVGLMLMDEALIASIRSANSADEICQTILAFENRGEQ